MHERDDVFRVFGRYLRYKKLPCEGGLLDQEEAWMQDFELCWRGIAHAEWKRDHPEWSEEPDLTGVRDWIEALDD